MNRFEKYSSYKDSGVEWLGEIPEHWEIKKLKFICKINQHSLEETTNKNLNITYVDIGSVSFEEGIKNSEKFIFSKAPSRARRIAKKNDTIISTVRTYLKAIDFIDESKSNYIFSTGFAILEPNLETNPKNLSFIVKSNFFTNQVDINSKGMSYPAINSTDLSNLITLIPPKEEQTKIASFLDDKTAQIDEVISQKQKLIELLKERKQIVINDAVTKGLDKDVEMTDSGVEWIGKIPKHWEIEKVKYIFKDSSIKNHGEEIPLAATQLYGVVPKDTLDYRTVEANVSDLNTFKLVKENNFVISLRSFEGGIEYSAYKGIISPAYTVMEALQDIAFKYFKYLFKSNIFIQALNIYKTGIREGQNISFAKFKDDFLPLPPKNEQIKIAEYIENQTTKIDKAIELQQNYISKLKEYKASLIDSVVTGKVKVFCD